jgi:hypothetical protein
MHATTVAVDLAKSVFQITVADDKWKVVEQLRLTRSQFERWFHNRDVGLVIMEACGSAHHWGRWLNGQGIEVKLLPAAYIREYVKRNKTDAADACALLEAARCADIVPVRVRCDPLAGIGLRHSYRTGTAGSFRCIDDDDLYARAEPGRTRCGVAAGCSTLSGFFRSMRIPCAEEVLP